MKRKIFLMLLAAIILFSGWRIYKNYRNKLLSVSDHLDEISN